MYTKNQLMFPHDVIPQLRDLRSERWAALVDRVTQVAEGDAENLAFMLMMVRLNGCLACETDSYRAMRGCDACAVQMLRRYKGTDTDLLNAYHQALEDVQRYLARTQRIGVEVVGVA